MNYLSSVFPLLEANDVYSSDILKNTEVVRLLFSDNRTVLHIYLKFKRLVDRSVLTMLSKEIDRLYLSSQGARCLITDSYELNDEYRLSDIVNLYRDTLIAELISEHPALKGAWSKSEWTVSDDSKIRISMQANLMTKALEEAWVKKISKCFLDRFSYLSEVSFEFHDAPRHIYVGPEDNVVIIEKTEKKETDSLMISDAPKEPMKKTPSSAGEKKQSARSYQGNNGYLNRGNGNSRGFVKTPKPNEEKNPNLIYGRAFSEESKSIESYGEEEGTVVIRGEILSSEKRELRNGEKTIITFSVTDYTDSINAKIFVRNEEVDEIFAALQPKKTVLIKGQTENDSFERELTVSHVYGIMKYDLPLREKRKDSAPVKRVELHAHTKSSENDAIIDAGDLVKTAHDWGHPAIAITDHGNVQSFPKAYHTVHDNPGIKVLYGMEGYLVDDTAEIAVNPENQPLSGPLVVLSVKTTGLSAKKNKLIELAAVKIENGEVTDTFSSLVNPNEKIPYRIEEEKNIRNDELSKAPELSEVLKDFFSFSEGCFLAAHNAGFAVSFLREGLRKVLPEAKRTFTYVDTVGISRALLTKISQFKLDQVAKELNVPVSDHVSSLSDARCTAEVFIALAKRLETRGIRTLTELNEGLKPTEEVIRKLPMHHIVIFAKNLTGKVNLYRLVSDSNLKYFRRRPRIPKSLLTERREGLLLGSACSAGELYEAILNGNDDEQLMRMVNFYDYLEIQPLGNNRYLIQDDDHDFIQSDEDLIEINKRIIELGDLYGKPVCATGDVHFMNPEDAIYRDILQCGSGSFETEEQPPLYLRTTEEMMAEFSYLGSEKAYEIVVTNTNKIADMIEDIAPVRPDKCPPVIENSDQDLRDHAFGRAKEMYGDPLPDIVEKRLSRELNAIIQNGYAVMYSIAHKLINKSLADGYLVGSRGSVGSSLAATMYNITEVNPLPPHYRCPNCRFSDFDSELVKSYSDNTGSDMPDRLCPKCGQPLTKDGYNIPFETFMGFKGNKEPDIDLNFSGEYQAKAHAYTEVIFGKGQTFKAGTVGTVAENTAAGFVRKYFEEKGIYKRRAEIARLSKPIEGVKRSTGQHPGGIIVLPIGEDINTFTPVQHPANDVTTNIITTHYDYHSIDTNLLKLDILGHDDPTMIRMLQDLIGIDPRSFPLDSKEVMSLFSSTEALKIKPEDIHGVPLGVMGIPEFGTDNAISMLLETKPKYVSDLIRISGLAHGTNVWHGNAETLIKEGKATISTAVCTRDDIMMYLISRGVESETAFTIMERVRKGAVAKKKCKEWADWKPMLIDHGVPDWYLWSCERIEYMFPKAHAAAYVMMALRIAYCKVFYPLQYYCAYFSIRASGFNYEMMCQGHSHMEGELERLRNMKDRNARDDDSYRDIRIVEEMYARGFSFVPIDIYRADSTRFQVVSETELMPALVTIDGLGEVAADTLVEAAKKGPFTSVNDLKHRTKVPQSILDKMTDLKILEGLPKDDQISLFDQF